MNSKISPLEIRMLRLLFMDSGITNEQCEGILRLKGYDCFENIDWEDFMFIASHIDIQQKKNNEINNDGFVF